MKKYPKVPRHDLDFVPEELFSASDLYLLEKMDGMNFRFMLYEERFHSKYDDIVVEQNPDDGDIVFGTKGVVRGCVSDDLESFEGDLHPAIEELRNIPEDVVSEYHDEYGPLVWFAEYMVPHTIDYGYETSPPPLFIGFDIYSPARDNRSLEDFPENPYKERFVGFLHIEETMEMFSRIGFETAPVVKSPDEFVYDEFSPSDFTVPQSEFGDVNAEGVVIRSDKMEIRSKYVTEEFRELNKMAMGSHTSDIDEPEKWLVESFVTTPRVRKQAQRLTRVKGMDFSLDDSFVEAVARRTLIDAWCEEFGEIKKLEEEIVPSDSHQIAVERTYHILERMKQMAARTGQSPEDAIGIVSSDSSSSVGDFDTPNVGMKDIELDIARRQSEKNCATERTLVEVIVGTDTINNIIDREVENSEKNLGSWLVGPVSEVVEDVFWSGDKSPYILWQLHIGFTPSEVNDEIVDMVQEELKKRNVEFPEGGKGWDPTEQEAETDAFSELF